MPRPISIPKLTRHKASGKAVVRHNGRDHSVGTFGTPEAETAYNRLIGEWLAQAPRRFPMANADMVRSQAGRSVNEVLLAFWTHARQHYRTPDGKPSTEVNAS